MSNKIFTKRELKILFQNKYVTYATTKGITYTDEFKRIFIAEYEKGKKSKQIFQEHGFDINMLGIIRVRAAERRWLSAYRKNGEDGLKDTRKWRPARPKESDTTIRKKYERLSIEINLLKAENELLKKIDVLERGLAKKK